MQYRLQPGAVARTELSGLPCVIEELLGIGGQGEVYRARLGDAPVALKWYLRSSATHAQQRRLRVLIHRGAPAATFLWPIEIVTVPGVEGFGYIMPLREPRFRDPRDILHRLLDPPLLCAGMCGARPRGQFPSTPRHRPLLSRYQLRQCLRGPRHGRGLHL